MKRYNPKLIEPKWQNSWSKSGLNRAVDFDERPKYVMLTEFPYPSGEGMHIGHMREYTIGDIIARQKRMQGYNVLYPMGFDAFGLPTENFAIKNKISPQLATETNVENFKRQLASMGFSFDWQRSFKTSDPNYYRWTQWLFLQFFKANMAYQSEIAVNWCSFCKTGLANEEVINGRHERCDTPVEKKMLKQWMLRITDYAERLIDGLSEVDYPSRIADQQINWIGRSKGAVVDFKLVDNDDNIQVFTTRPDTLYGATFLVLAPEHPLVTVITSTEQKPHVNNYIKEAQSKSDIERQAADKEKTGIFSGAYATNPANQKKVPIWIADYVLMGYGSGAIMAVPAHDERDYAFATRYQLPIEYVVEPISGQSQGDEVNKEAIVAIVFNPRDNKYLVLDWGPRQARHGGQLFIGGGIEDREDAISAAKREIAEETGYVDVKLIRQLPYQVHSYYYSNVKKQNYYAKMQGLLFELVSDKQELPALDEGEKSKFTVNWLSGDDVRRVVDDQGHKQIFQALTGSAIVTGEGLMVASGEYDNLTSSSAREKIVSDLEKQGLAEEKINYRLRDWIFSRQHYWGEPIPIIHCAEHGAVAVPEDQLPVLLPDVDHYEPSDDGRSPLAAIESWVNTVCPVCSQPAKRETDTMPNWAGSSWYYLRYFDPQNNHQFVDSKLLDYWQQVDLYLGGMEHVTLHLLYSRFWHQFLFDQGLVPTREPYAVRRGQGIIQAADGTKMSKSKGNIVNPSEIIDSGYGADALRLAIIFLAPYDQTTPWSPETLGGTFRFLQRIWTLIQEFALSDRGTNSSEELKRAVNRMVKRVSSDLLDMSFNTPIAAMMDCVNQLYKLKAKDNFNAIEWPWALETLIKTLAPFAPHITEELWQQLGAKESVHIQQWPTYDEQYVKELTLTIAVQINGKIRGQLTVEADTSEEQIIQIVLNNHHYDSYLIDKTIKRSIYVPAKLLSLVTD